MRKQLLAGSLALALTACGSPKKSADAIANDPGGNSPGQQGGAGGRLSQGDLQTQCQAKSTAAFTTPDFNFCIVPSGLSLPDGYASNVKVPADPGYHAGKYIVSHGTKGAAMLVLGTTRVGNDINFRGLGPLTSGTLYIQVLQSTNSQSDVTTYDCFDYNMHAVYCNDGIIP